MKKLLCILLVICLAFAGFLTWKNYTPRASGKTDDAVEASGIKTVDFDALYATHSPDEVVMKINGKDVTWGDFFYIFHYGASSMEQTFLYYGMSMDWDMKINDEDGTTIGQAVNSDTIQQLKDFCAIETLGEQTDIDQASVLAEAEETFKGLANDYAAQSGGTEEDFYALLEGQYLDKDTYTKFLVRNLTENELFTKLYGANGELVSDEDALKYLADKEYARINHILFMCKDMSTGEELDEAAQKEKLAQAQALTEELCAAADTDELLALFAQRKGELDEDTGKTAYPDGYICTPDASFVPEFLDGGYALAEYEVSEPVKSMYGYHVLLRLPVGADEILDESTGATARMLIAQERYNAALSELSEGFDYELVNGFQLPNISDFVR